MQRRSSRLGIAACVALLLSPALPAVLASEAAILANIKGYFATQDPARRAELVRQIESDSAFDRGKLSGWLHAAGLFESREAGLQDLQVPIDTGQTRNVSIRIPANYDPGKPYPLIYALHGTGGDGPSFIPYVVKFLGKDAEQYIIAAPTAYEQKVIDQGGPASAEHLQVLTALRKHVHTDSDRVIVTGYSLGGHTAWTLAVLHSDQFASAMPISGSLILPNVDKLWPDFLPNLANSHLAAFWGEKDTLDEAGTGESPHGGVAGMNRKLIELARKSNVNAVGYEYPGLGHGGIRPQPELLTVVLSKRREHYPKKLTHTFRKLYQAQAYWLEAAEWKGEAWTDEGFKGTLKPGEDPRDALVREMRSRLGQLAGEINGQSVRFSRKHVDDVTVWLGDTPDTGMDWTQPVAVFASGKKAFEGKLQPSLELCLKQAAQSYDFDRLRWAGLRIKGSNRPQVLTGH